MLPGSERVLAYVLLRGRGNAIRFGADGPVRACLAAAAAAIPVSTSPMRKTAWGMAI